MMNVKRRRISESFVYSQVHRNAGYPLVSPDNVRDFHRRVIDYIGQVVGWIAIRFQHDEVVNRAVIESNIPVYQVVERYLAFKRYFHTYNRLDSPGFIFILLFGGKIAAVTVVSRRLLARHLLFTHLIQSIRKTIAAIH